MSIASWVKHKFFRKDEAKGKISVAAPQPKDDTTPDLSDQKWMKGRARHRSLATIIQKRQKKARRVRRIMEAK